jgi:O-antigen/teichoic acid export membrane protein
MLNKLKLPSGIKHSLWSILDASLYPAAYLATVPVMLRSLGATTFGLWIILSSLVTILQLFNFNSGIANLGIATVRGVSYANANNDNQHAADTVNAVLHITAALFGVVTLVGLALSYLATHFGWWGLHEAPGIHVALCVLLAAVIAGLRYFDQVFQSIIKAYEHFKLASVLNMTGRFGLLLINLTLAGAKYSLTVLFVANIVFSLVYILAQYLFVKKIIPFYNVSKVKDNTQYKRVLSFSLLPWLQSLIIVFTFQSDRFWVSSYVGLKEVSGYGLSSTMFNHIHMIFTAMAVWMLPRVAGMVSRGEDPSQKYELVRYLLLSFIVISLLGFNIVAPTLIHAWTGEEMYSQMSVYVKHFIAFELVFAHSIMPLLFLNAAGRERLATKITISYCALCYIFMLVSLWQMRTPAALIMGMTASLCITMPVVNIWVARAIGRKASWRSTVLEMLPVYLSVISVYQQSGSPAYFGFSALAVFLTWQIYLSNIVKKRIWRQQPNI